jgi:hypothetical protein
MCFFDNANKIGSIGICTHEKDFLRCCCINIDQINPNKAIFANFFVIPCYKRVTPLGLFLFVCHNKAFFALCGIND